METAASSAPHLPDTDVYAPEILAEQTKIVYRHLPVLLAINTLVGSGVVFGLWEVVAQSRLVAWLGALFAVIVLRATLYAAYRRNAGGRSGSTWRTWFTVGSGAAGALWGATGVFLFPADSLQYQLFVLFVLVGMGAGAVSSLTAYMPAFYAYFPVSMLPAAVTLFTLHDPIHYALAVMTIVYVAALAFFGNTINKALVESLGLRFQNIDLVRELSEQRDEAERANVSKSKFLAAASHDLRQPLHALTLFTSALDERIHYPEVRRIVDNINASVRALEKLFNALLDISRLDAGVLRPEIRHFRMDDVLRRLVNDYAPDAAAKNLALVCDPTAAVVRSDPALLERILRNYVSNAIRYTDRGEVRVNCVPLDNGVRIEVADTGMGIPEAHQRDIFNEFYQLGNPERDRTKGLGLGLAIVDRVARLLEHPISVKSAPGRGACFTVVVPLGDAEQIAPESPSDGAETNHDLSGLRVIVVDDEVGGREGMRTLLAQWGCDVVVAGSEDEAVAAVHAAGRAPEVAIVDYRLRDERTGVQAVERLRREFGGAIPALIVTGDTAPERIREAQASNYPLVHKPVSPAALRTFLRKLRNKAPASIH